jgi:hypothetical protein
MSEGIRAASNRRWLVASLAATGVVLCLTLLPGSDRAAEASETTPFLCLVCGETGMVDVILNLLLLVPLGFSLQRAGWPTRRAMAFGVGLTLLIEGLQLVAIPGRDASLSDLLTNSLGCWLGISLGNNLSRLFGPSPREARRLGGAAAALAGLMMVATGWLLAPSLPDARWYGQWAAELGQYERFEGTVLAANANEVPVPSRLIERDVELREAARRDGWSLTTRFLGGPTTRGTAPIVSIFDARQRKVLLLGQLGEDLLFEPRMRAEDWRLRPPRFSLKGVLAGATGDSISARAQWRDGIVRLDSRRGAEQRETAVNLSPGLGWALLSPVERPLGREADWLSVLWTVAWWLPVGFYGILAGTHPGQQVARARILALGAGVVLAGAASLNGLPLPGWPLWAATLGGVLTGVALARRTRATARPPYPEA